MRKIIALFILFASCINPYDFSLDESRAYLVVEGYVSNKAGDSEIRLSRSGVFQEKTFDWVSNAEVMVIENEANEHPYAHHENGLYKPVQEDFSATRGSTYRLKIILEGQLFESERVSLQNSLEIDNLSYKSTSLRHPRDPAEHPRLALQITSDINEDASRYYIYTIEETWLARSIYPRDEVIEPKFTYNEYHEPIDITFEAEPLEEDVAFCWPSSKSVGIITATTEGLSRNQLIDVPVFMVNLESEKVLYKYSALVNQYAISQETHHFFNMLKEFSENSGLLYDIQPGFISGNIHNLTTPEDRVIGMFYAASHTSSRIFIYNADLAAEEWLVVMRYVPKCEYYQHLLPKLPPDSIPDPELTAGLQFLQDSLMVDKGLMIRRYDFMETASEDSVILLDLSYFHCMDCRVYGSNIKPDWWGDIY